MEKVKIYLSGSMDSVSFEERSKWRNQIMDAITYNYESEKKPLFFNPANYDYSFADIKYKTQREAMNFDLNALRNSNLVIVNFDDPSNLSICAELAIAYDMKIPIVGINKDGKELHPWLECFCDRMCTSIKEAVEYVVEFYLN